MFSRGSSRVLIILLSVVAILALMPSLAGASGNDPPSGTSLTNPMYPTPPDPFYHFLPHPDDAAPFPLSWWRQGWGSSSMPQYTFEHPDPNTPGGIQGFYYVVDRSADTTLNLSDTGEYYQSSVPVNTLVSLGYLNIMDVYYQDAPSGGWAYSEPGMRVPWEGQWYLHLMWYDMAATGYMTHHVPVGIDQTPPLAVSTLMARPSWSYVGPVNIWFPTRRAHVTWENKEYDALSGVAKYDVYVDGEFATEKFEADHIFESVTLEDLTGGKHTIDVYAVDRAANVSPKATTYFYSDPDTPTVSITYPASGQQAALNSTFKASAKDEGGIQWVNFAIDGVSIGTDYSYPYSITKNMSSYSNSTHTLTVKAKDMYGRVVSTSRTFTIDKSVPVVSSVSDTPDPFYPMIVDGYKDATYIKFWCSEGGLATLDFYTSRGDLWARRTVNVSAGWHTISWTGITNDGDKATGTFTYNLSVKDAAGNVGSVRGNTTTIRDYEIIRIAPNAVRVVPR